MIEVIYKRKKLRKGYKDITRGYVDGKKYLNEKKELKGYLENNIFKFPDGTPILTFSEEGIIYDGEDEKIGYYENERVDWSEMYGESFFAKYCKRGYDRGSGEIFHYKGQLMGYLKGDISMLTDLDYLGILVSYFGVGA